MTVLRVLPLLAFLVWIAPANAAPTVSVQAVPTLGPAPLDVTLTASGDAIAYRWDLGDKTQAEGPVVQHRYGAGRFTATVTATAADGSSAQSSVTIIAAQLTLTAPTVATYGKPVTLRGRMVPALRGAPITLYAADSPLGTVKADRKGRFRLQGVRQLPRRTSRGSRPSHRTQLQSLCRRGSTSRSPTRACSASASSCARSSSHETRERCRSESGVPVASFGHACSQTARPCASARTSVADYVVRITVTPNGSYHGRQEDLAL